MSLFTRLAWKSSRLGFQRLRSVSTSPSLSHISADTSNNNSLLIINHGNPYFEIYGNGGEDDEHVFKHKKNLCFPTESSSYQLYVCGGGGLSHDLCVYSNCKYFSILNPVTRETKRFPFPFFIENKECEHLFVEAHVHLLGFGFDSKVNEFKVVRSVTYDSQLHRMEMFSPNSMQDAIEIDVVGEIRSLRPSRCGVPSVDGVCYWSVKDDYHEKTMRVLSFDFEDQVFDLFTLPPCYYINYNPHTEDCLMQTFNGLPAAIRYNADYDDQDKFFEVWLKEKKETWVKEMSIGPIFDVIKPLCFFNNKGLILLDSDYQLVLYDFVMKQLKKLDIKLPKPSASEDAVIQVLNFNLPETETTRVNSYSPWWVIDMSIIKRNDESHHDPPVQSFI